MLKFVHTTRQLLLRVRIILDKKVHFRHKGACKCLEWLSKLQFHSDALQRAPETLFRTHQMLSTHFAVPLFDVASARVIESSGVLPLPTFIGDLNAAPKPPTGRRRHMLEAEANVIVYRLLHTARWPKGLTLFDVRPQQPHILEPAGVFSQHVDVGC
jgi:hypothetical protein